MNIRRSWFQLALLFLVAVGIGFAIPGTLAYITAQSNTVVNTFGAPYFSPEQTDVDVQVQVTIRNIGTESIGPEGFTIMLQDTESGETFTATTDSDGNAQFSLAFTNDDLGKSHTYTLTQINDGRENIIYSDRVYTIEITLSVNADNQIVAIITMDGNPVEQIIAEFENIYFVDAEIPLTGDDNRIGLYFALTLISGAALVILRPKREDRAVR